MILPQRRGRDPGANQLNTPPLEDSSNYRPSRFLVADGGGAHQRKPALRHRRTLPYTTRAGRRRRLRGRGREARRASWRQMLGDGQLQQARLAPSAAPPPSRLAPPATMARQPLLSHWVACSLAAVRGVLREALHVAGCGGAASCRGSTGTAVQLDGVHPAVPVARRVSGAASREWPAPWARARRRLTPHPTRAGSCSIARRWGAVSDAAAAHRLPWCAHHRLTFLPRLRAGTRSSWRPTRSRSC